jgi:hypothetical protein
MIKLNSIISFAILAFASATYAQDLFVKKGIFSQYETTTEKLQKIDYKNTINDYPIINIGEDMRLFWSKVTYSTGVVIPSGKVVIYTVKDKKVLHALEMTANLANGNASDWTDEPCKRDNFLWKRSLGGTFNNINCVSINHHVNYFVAPTGDYQQISVEAKDAGIEFPPTMIRVAFTRFSSNGRRLVYFVDVNPEQYGVSRDATTPWGSNGWYKDFIKKDPKKVEFIANLTKWASDAQDRIELAFKKDSKAFENLKSIEEYLTGNKVSSSNGKDKSGNIEEKLSILKSIYAKGLLTEPQYNEQVKILLEGIK